MLIAFVFVIIQCHGGNPMAQQHPTILSLACSIVTSTCDYNTCV